MAYSEILDTLLKPEVKRMLTGYRTNAKADCCWLLSEYNKPYSFIYITNNILLHIEETRIQWKEKRK